MEGSSEAKKPKGALAVLAFGGVPAKDQGPRSTPKGGSEAEYEAERPEVGAHDMAFESFANSAGIPAGNRSRAMDALKQFVKSCMREYASEE